MELRLVFEIPESGLTIDGLMAPIDRGCRV